MVVIGSSATDPTCVMQERTAWPPTRTVHAPQIPIPHPNLAPSRLSTSRNTHRSGVSGGTSTVVTTSLTVSLSGICLLQYPPAEKDRSREHDWGGISIPARSEGPLVGN